MATFQELNLIPALQQAIHEEGYAEPTPIQEATIPPALEGLDILGCAQTGTGKTAAFALPILNHFASHDFKTVAKRPMGLILAPTRELAIQIGQSFNTYGRHVSISHAMIYGGVGQESQVAAVESGVHILVATPGRLLDLMTQEHIFLNRLQIFVLDEADRMLDMGFMPELKRIIKVLPIRRQSLFFSATMPAKIVELADKLLHHPVRVNVAAQQTNTELIDQRVIFADHRQKKPLLVSLLKGEEVGQAMVFTTTKRGANSVAENLQNHGIQAVAIHGNKSQNARQGALDAFRSDKVKVLVSTDLAARGIDVDGITHVFNFELPTVPEGYVHRVGRTGRAGERGIAIAFCSNDELPQLRNIEKLIGFEILEDGRKPEPLPPAPEVTDESSRPPRRRHSHTGPLPVEKPTASAGPDPLRPEIIGKGSKKQRGSRRRRKG